MLLKVPKILSNQILSHFSRKKNTLQKLIGEKRAEIKTNEAKKTQILAEIEKLKKEIKNIDKLVEKKNQEIETTIQQFNQSDTILRTLMKMIDDKSNFDILDQKVFNKTKSLVMSIYKAIYNEDMVYNN